MKLLLPGNDNDLRSKITFIPSKGSLFRDNSRDNSTVTFPKVLDYEAVMDEVRLQDVSYQHLLKQFDSNGSTINIKF